MGAGCRGGGAHQHARKNCRRGVWVRRVDLDPTVSKKVWATLPPSLHPSPPPSFHPHLPLSRTSAPEIIVDNGFWVRGGGTGPRCLQYKRELPHRLPFTRRPRRRLTPTCTLGGHLYIVGGGVAPQGEGVAPICIVDSGVQAPSPRTQTPLPTIISGVMVRERGKWW